MDRHFEGPFVTCLSVPLKSKRTLDPSFTIQLKKRPWFYFSIKKKKTGFTGQFIKRPWFYHSVQKLPLVLPLSKKTTFLPVGSRKYLGFYLSLKKDPDFTFPIQLTKDSCFTRQFKKDPCLTHL